MKQMFEFMEKMKHEHDLHLKLFIQRDTFPGTISITFYFGYRGILYDLIYNFQEKNVSNSVMAEVYTRAEDEILQFIKRLRG